MNTKTLKHLFTFCLALCLLFTTLNAQQQKKPQKLETLLSLIKEKSGLSLQLPDAGFQWKDEDCKGTTEKGEVTFNDGKWLMYLIHWGPIQTETITVDYVKKRMLDMWGVPFQFTGKEGKTTMAGHDAVFVEAYGTNKAFYSRYIVWNCPESGREFIADTNYNLKLKTPEADFELEKTSAATLQCHTGAPIKDSPQLTATYSSRRYGFSFYYPDRWFIFDSPYYAPFPQYEGLRSAKMGSLLGLCSDQNLRVTVQWQPLVKEKKQKSMAGTGRATIKLLKEITETMSGVNSRQIFGSESFSIGSRPVTRIWGDCTCDVPEAEKDFLTGKGIFQSAAVELKEKGKTVIITLFTRQYKNGAAVSTPTRHFQDTAMRDLIKGLE
ncbi:MAG: hypothetical protein GY765_19850 [bacterium]|nr:hypothetical protein [bacterium]